MTRQERMEMIASNIFAGIIASAPTWSEAMSNMDSGNMQRALNSAEKMMEKSERMFEYESKMRLSEINKEFNNTVDII